MAIPTNRVVGVRTPVPSGTEPFRDWPATLATGFHCGTDEKCVAIVPNDAPCTDTAQCSVNHVCDKTCKLGKLPGAPCVDSDLCIGGRCDPTRHACNGDCIEPSTTE